MKPTIDDTTKRLVTNALARRHTPREVAALFEISIEDVEEIRAANVKAMEDEVNSCLKAGLPVHKVAEITGAPHEVVKAMWSKIEGELQREREAAAREQEIADGDAAEEARRRMDEVKQAMHAAMQRAVDGESK